MKKSELFFVFILLPVDILMIAVSFVLAYYFRFGLGNPAELVNVTIYQYLRYSLFIIPPWIAIFALNGLYDTQVGRGMFNIFYRIFISNSVAILLLVLGVFFSQSFFFSRLIMLWIWLLSIVLVMLGRVIVRLIQLYLMRFGICGRGVLLIGDNEVAEFIAAEIKKHPHLGYKVVGVINGETTGSGHLRRLGTLKQSENIIKKYQVDDVILAEARLSRSKTSDLVQFCANNKITFKFIPDLIALTSLNAVAGFIGSMPVLEIKTIALDGWGRIIKRIFDVIFSITILSICSPIMLVVAVVQKLTSKGPIVYGHERVGRDGKIFILYKFRSMYNQAENKRKIFWTKKDDLRVTPFGKFLRKTNLDELPQFWNILKGNMSVVGPRPEQPRFVAKFSQEIPDYFHRHRVKSGLTGWAQVNGLKGDTSITERVRYDTFYIENWSLWFDLKIIIRTIWLILYEIFVGKYEYSAGA